jgi:hypothetical protein
MGFESECDTLSNPTMNASQRGCFSAIFPHIAWLLAMIFMGKDNFWKIFQSPDSTFKADFVNRVADRSFLRYCYYVEE